jgi:hypothetical protein
VIVVDASVVIEVLLNTPAGIQIAERFSTQTKPFTHPISSMSKSRRSYAGTREPVNSILLVGLRRSKILSIFHRPDTLMISFCSGSGNYVIMSPRTTPRTSPSPKRLEHCC